MKSLPDSFKANGFTYTLLKRSRHAALYSQAKTTALSGKVEVYSWEAHFVRRKSSRTSSYTHPNGSISLVERPEREILANNNEFGTYAWSYQTLPRAEQKFEELNAK